MSAFDLSGTVYKILPLILEDVYGWPISDVRNELTIEVGHDVSDLDPEEMRGRLAARKAHRIARAMVCEFERLAWGGREERAPKTGKRAEREAA